MSKKRRWLERGKSLLILLLSLSALYLLSLTPLVQDSGILDLLASKPAGGENTAAVTLTAAARPSRMAVHNGEERYGVQYDQSAADELFARLGPLLGEALTSSGAPASIPESRWQQYLRGKGIYFDFTGEIPLSALGRWLSQEGECALTASARRVLLAGDGEDGVLLCYQDADSGRFFACRTGLTESLHLDPAVAGTAGNGALFAFESESWSRLLQPYTLITENSARRVYAAATPISPSGDLSALLAALNYSDYNHTPVSGGELYLDGNDRLRILTDGRVIYDAAQPGKYPVATAGSEMTVAEAIEAARELAENTIGTQCGEAELYLISAKETDSGCRIRFGYRLDGSTVWLYDEGWAADFLIRDGYVTGFTLCYRSYTDAGQEALLLTMDRAAVMLPDLTEEKCELILQYRDRGESAVSPVWVAN